MSGKFNPNNYTILRTSLKLLHFTIITLANNLFQTKKNHIPQKKTYTIPKKSPLFAIRNKQHDFKHCYIFLFLLLLDTIRAGNLYVDIQNIKPLF